VGGSQKPFIHKDGLAYSAHSLIRQNPPFKTDLAYDLLAAIHKAAMNERVSDALNPLFSQVHHNGIK